MCVYVSTCMCVCVCVYVCVVCEYVYCISCTHTHTHNPHTPAGINCLLCGQENGANYLKPQVSLPCSEGKIQ